LSGTARSTHLTCVGVTGRMRSAVATE
jgi:hypothetical protein